MQDTPRVMIPSDISLGGVSVGISLSLRPCDIPTPAPPHEILYGFVTLRESCLIWFAHQDEPIRDVLFSWNSYKCEVILN